MKLLKKAFLGFLFILISAGVFLTLVLVLDLDSASKQQAFDPSKKKQEQALQPSTAPEDSVNNEDNYSLDEHTLLALTEETTAKLLSEVSLSQLVEKMLPSMVAIDAKVSGYNIFGQESLATSQGSGVIISEDEENFYIVTNEHVIDGADTITATLATGQEVDVSVRGSDAVADLAVLLLSKNQLTEESLQGIGIAALADSAQTTPGEMVIALGNSLGYGTSVTVGYVSAINRTITTDNGISMTLIQTDAAINPGNSGGALINLSGELIGINSSKLSSVSIEGMGFAIPASLALPVLNELQNIEDIPEEEKGYLGVRISTVTSAMAEEFDMPTGVYLNEVIAGSAAEEAMLQAGDIIVEVNGIAIATADQLSSRITCYRYQTTVTLTVMRRIQGEYKQLRISVVLMSEAEINALTGN